MSHKKNQSVLLSMAALFLAGVTVIATYALAPGPPEYEIVRSTIDGGGVMSSAGGTFELSGTIGQPDAGEVMFGGNFELTGGFWLQTPLNDCNSTGNVDLLDHADFEHCLVGPGGGLRKPSCNCFDIDNDSDVDLSDASRLQRSFDGG